MQAKDFDALVAEVRAADPIWFELENESPVSKAEVQTIEHTLSVELPAEFVDFLCRYGAGPFAFAMVLGVQAGTDWELLKHLPYVSREFIPVIDLHTGDYYGFVVNNGKCAREVSVWDHEVSRVVGECYSDFYEMIKSSAFGR